MNLEIKNLLENETIEAYFDNYFNSPNLSAELIKIPENSINEFTEKSLQIPGGHFLLTCRIIPDENFLDYMVLLKLYSWVWLNPIILEIKEDFGKWWDLATMEISGYSYQKRVCSVWKIRTFKGSSVKSLAFTIPKVLPLSNLDRFNVLTEDLIKARFSAALFDLNSKLEIKKC